MTKIIAMLICIFFILTGGFFLTVKKTQDDIYYDEIVNELVDDETAVIVRQIKDEPLNKAIIELKAAIEVKSDELRVAFEKVVAIIGNDTKDSKRDYKEILKQYEKKKAVDEKIKLLIKNIEKYISFRKKIVTTNVFFKHVLKLIFILSGIFGLFWISIWKYREEREERESKEKKEIHEWESAEREKELILKERLKILESFISKNEFKFEE